MKPKRRVIIAHGWNDGDKNAWINWLTAELESRGYEVIAPVFPHGHVPRPVQWVKALQEAVGDLDRNTVIVAYSLGAPTALRFLSDYARHVRLAGLVLVSGFATGPLEKAGLWFDESLDYRAIKRRARNRVMIYSNNDRLVRPAMSRRLAQDIGAREVVIVGGGHLTGLPMLPGSRDQMPAVLEAVLDSYKFDLRGSARRMIAGAQVWLRPPS